jgi:hypothetical protein
VLVPALVAIAALGAACKPRPGASCRTDGREACAASSLALVCREGTWKEMPCRGKDGCRQRDGEVACDQTFAESGDLCADEGKAVCTPDTRSALECRSGKWTLRDKCLGPKGCSTDATYVHCDNSVGNAGDPCGQNDDHACALDAKSMLVCRSDRWELASHCRGANGCRSGGDDITCDQSLAEVDDPCAHEGNPACSTDLRALLACKGGKMAVEETCRKTCDVKGTGAHSGTVGCK